MKLTGSAIDECRLFSRVFFPDTRMTISWPFLQEELLTYRKHPLLEVLI